MLRIGEDWQEITGAISNLERGLSLWTGPAAIGVGYGWGRTLMCRIGIDDLNIYGKPES
jgi:hypothetical protein